MQKNKTIKTVPEQIEEFLQSNPEVANMLLVGEMKEIHKAKNDFDRIKVAFYFGYMKSQKTKEGGSSVEKHQENKENELMKLETKQYIDSINTNTTLGERCIKLIFGFVRRGYIECQKEGAVK